MKTNKMKVFISGPMTGIAENNFSLFYKAADILKEKGYEVVNPADLFPEDRCAPNHTRREYITAATLALLPCDAICMLSEWGESLGARAERQLALSLGIKVAYMTYSGLIIGALS
jgi:hypothetical protein